VIVTDPDAADRAAAIPSNRDRVASAPLIATPTTAVVRFSESTADWVFPNAANADEQSPVMSM
jgi:hypothetical protein